MAVHEPHAGVVTDEPDDGVALRRNDNRALDDWIHAVPRRRPVTTSSDLYVYEGSPLNKLESGIILLIVVAKRRAEVSWHDMS